MGKRAVLVCVVAVALRPEPAIAQGEPLGPEFRVNTYTTGDQYWPSVAADASGNFVVVWAGYGPGEADRGIFGQRFSDSGAPLGPEFRVNTYTADNQRLPRVASDVTGNFVVVWESLLTGEIYAQRYAASGTPLGPQFRVNTYFSGDQSFPSVAAGPAGSFVVVWYSPQVPFGGLFGQRFAGSGAPLGSEFRVNSYATSIGIYPAVAADAAGNFVVVWANAISSYDIIGQRFAASGPPLGSEFRVNTITPGDQKRPAVASDPAGNFVVVWESDVTSVRGQRFSASGAPAGPEFTVDAGLPFHPSVAADGSGNFVVAWTDDALTDVLGRRFAADGTPLSTTFLVNSDTTYGQVAANVAADTSGRFVVVWTSAGQDGSQDGVFGQRYAPILPVELIHFAVE